MKHDLMHNISLSKQALRRQLSEKRRQSKEFNEQYNSLLIKNITQFIHSSYDNQQVIACFWPLDNEVDLRFLINHLHDEHYKVVLPETTKKGCPLVFRLWTTDVEMIQGRYSTLHPNGPIIHPDVILVPLLAFDRFGNRLGYGGGYYDRTFEMMPNTQKIGVAFSYQEVEKVPTESCDHSLSVVITEQEIIQVKKEEKCGLFF